MTTFALREHIARKSRTARSWACGITQLLLLSLISTGCGPLQGTVVVTIEEDGARTLTEGEKVRFTVRARPAPAADLTVPIDWSETGTVLAGSQPRTVTIEAGATSAMLTARTVDDGADESANMVTVTLRGGAGYTVGNPDSAAVTVNDNDGPVVTIAAGADQVTEGEDVLIAVRATPAAAADLVATLRVTETGSMLGTSPSTATITAGATTTTAPIRLDCRSSAWQAPRRRCVKAKRSSSG